MNIGPEETGRMTLWQYTGLLHQWNKIRDPEGAEDIEPPPAAVVAERLAALEGHAVTGVKH